MPDPRFFVAAGPFSAAELGERAGAAVEGDGARRIAGVAPLDRAGPADLSFFDHPRYLAQFRASRAGAVAIRPSDRRHAPPGAVLLVSPDPHRTFARAAALLYPETPPKPGIAPSAVIAGDARISADCTIEAGAFIAARAEIGARCVIGPGAVIGPAVALGEGCRVGAHASLTHCLLGARVHVYPGARIGQEGFGFVPSPEGHIPVPQLGRVLIGDGAEIGANTTIDRGSGPDTVVGAGCWIDNLVHIGHNVQLGRGCIVAGMTGIAGSTVLEDFVAIGGQVGIAGHLRIGKGARIAGGSGVIRDVAAGETVGGYPAIPVRAWHRQTIALARLAETAAEGVQEEP